MGAAEANSSAIIRIMARSSKPNSQRRSSDGGRVFVSSFQLRSLNVRHVMTEIVQRQKKGDLGQLIRADYAALKQHDQL